MTSDANQKDDLERPFSSHEKIRLIIFSLTGYPIGLSVVLLSGAYVRSYPHMPDLWYGFWVTVIGIPCIMMSCLPWLFDCPRVLRQRMRKLAASKEESIPEQRFHKVTTLIFFSAMFVTSYDAASRADSFPKLWNWLGFTSMVVATAWIIWVMRTNKYASRVVHVQPGQKLITTGPYSFVRHPMYMAIVPSFYGLPLSVGSIWGLLPMSFCIFMIAFRTFDEEDFLVKTFGNEYLDYRKKVPYKMCPYIF